MPKELSNCKKLTLRTFNAFTINEELADLEAIATFFVEGTFGSYSRLDTEQGECSIHISCRKHVQCIYVIYAIAAYC
jgi:hypothetical protein